MDIKVGDIVAIKGREQRVTRRSVKYVTLAQSGTVLLEYVEQRGTVVKPITNQQLDIVILFMFMIFQKTRKTITFSSGGLQKTNILIKYGQ